MGGFPGLSPESQGICSRARLQDMEILATMPEEEPGARVGQARPTEGHQRDWGPQGLSCCQPQRLGATLSWQRAWGRAGVSVPCPLPASTPPSPGSTGKFDDYLAECSPDTISLDPRGAARIQISIIPSKSELGALAPRPWVSHEGLVSQMVTEDCWVNMW